MKKIVIKDCLECPVIEDCKEIKKLSPKVRVAMSISTSISGILKTCPLGDDK